MALGYKTPRKLEPLSAAVTPLDQAVGERGRFEKETQLDVAKIESREAHRLGCAAEKHNSIIARLQADRDRRSAALQAEIAKVESEAAEFDEAANQEIAAVKLRELEQQSFEHRHQSREHEARRDAAQARDFHGQYLEHSMAAYQHAMEEATRAVDGAAAEARAGLQVRQRRREEARARSLDEMDATQIDGSIKASVARATGRAEILRTEVARHRAALTVALSHERAQAARSIANQQIQRNIASATTNAAALEREAFETRVECDRELGVSLHKSARNLQDAREHCRLVKERLQEEAAAYKRQMNEIERGAHLDAKDVERLILQMESDRLVVFNQGHRLVKEAEANFRGHRDVCEGELDAVHQRLRAVEQETQAIAKRILDQWLEGNKATEQKIRELEKTGEDELKAMITTVSELIAKSSANRVEVQTASSNTVAALEAQSNEIVDSTQPAQEAARKSHDEAAAAARAETLRLKPVPQEIQAEADEQIRITEEQAANEIERLRLEADAMTERAQAAATALREEEEWLRERTADAWKRIRHAIYQIRLFNLHDFAEAISQGQFDRISPSGQKAHWRVAASA
eukprot:TRINITY_DN15326_c1_g2_i1.p1 TRINITY_DN15326_c1_g2~~TRINITY_DN15326_c1_g2_i1.p1  ORF type:complete len:579 (+),score=127.03 TRINITY_DN15326_c1_g2_i1:135-1871(+)